jgi:hypothetical protein
MKNTRWPQTNHAPQHCPRPASKHQWLLRRYLAHPLTFPFPSEPLRRSSASLCLIPWPRHAAANRLGANAAAKARWLVKVSAPSNDNDKTLSFTRCFCYCFFFCLQSSRSACNLFYLICYAHNIYNGSTIVDIGGDLAILRSPPQLSTNRQWQRMLLLSNERLLRRLLRVPSLSRLQKRCRRIREPSNSDFEYDQRNQCLRYLRLLSQ